MIAIPRADDCSPLQLTGGGGKDTFVVTGGTTEITDFSQQDRIEVQNSGARVISVTVSDQAAQRSIAAPDTGVQTRVEIDPEGSGTTTIVVLLDGAYADLQTTSDANGIFIAAACYAAGTRISTDQGPRAIETLAIGENVLTAAGLVRPIRWLGHRTLDLTRHPDPQSVWPILVRADAFSAGQPSRDLWLSPGHNIAREGVLIPISALVNDRTIVQIQRPTIEYWHLELDQHDIILAEGLPAASYLDTGNRAAFANGSDHVALHPDFKPRHWTDTCLPLKFEGQEVHRMKAVVFQQTKALGHLITHDADPYVLANGKRFEPALLGNTRLAFLLPQGCDDIELRSRNFVPSYIDPASQDLRTLGLCVGRLQIDGEDLSLDREADFGTGWHALERQTGHPDQRWTNGATPVRANTRLIVIDLAGPGHYWADEETNVVALFG